MTQTGQDQRHWTEQEKRVYPISEAEQDAIRTATAILDRAMQKANAEIYAPAFTFNPATGQDDRPAPIGDDRLPFLTPRQDGITWKSRIRQRAFSHAQRWNNPDVDDVESRLNLKFCEAVSQEPDLLTAGHTYGYLLNRVTWMTTDQDKVESYRRAHIYGNSLDATAAGQDDDTTLGELTPDDRLDLNRFHLSKDVQRALDSLPDDQRTAIIAAKMLGLDRAETAKILDKTENQTRYIMRKALKALREMMTDYDDDATGPQPAHSIRLDDDSRPMTWRPQPAKMRKGNRATAAGQDWTPTREQVVTAWITKYGPDKPMTEKDAQRLAGQMRLAATGHQFYTPGQDDRPAHSHDDEQRHPATMNCSCAACQRRPTDETSPTVQTLPALASLPDDRNYNPSTWRFYGFDLDDWTDYDDNLTFTD